MGFTEIFYDEDESTLLFISEEHRRFYEEKLAMCRYQDVYHKALVYTLGICNDTRRNIDTIYDFKSGMINVDVLAAGWQTSGSLNVCRLAFNLYTNAMPSADEDVMDKDDLKLECSLYSVEDLFACGYAPFFYQAICIRYPEYTKDNRSLHKAFGSLD